MTKQSQAFLFAGLTVLCWSTVATALKLSLEWMSPMQLIFVSMSTAVVALAVPLLWDVRQNWRRVAALGWADAANALLQGLMLYCYYILLFMAYERLPAQVAQPVNSTWALMLALLASFLMGQRLPLREFLFMLLAYSGVIIVASGGGGNMGPLNPVGLACVMGSTMLYAVYWLVNARSRTPHLLGLFLCFSVAAVLAWGTLLVGGQSLAPSWRAAAPGIYVGLFELAVPFILWGLALRYTSSVARISTLSFLVPFLALFWINVIIHEPIAWTTLVGLSLIVTGTFLQQRAAQKREIKA